MSNKFEITPRTKEIIANFASINPSLLFREGNSLKTIAASKDMFASATVVESFPKEFAIYDLSRFLGALSLFPDPTLAFNEKALLVRNNEENRQISYVYASPNMIISAPDRDVQVPDTIAKFDIPKKTLNELNKAVGLLKLPNVVFVSDGKVVVLEASDVKNPTGDKYMVKVGESDKAFKTIFKAEMVSKLIEGDYTVTIAHGPIKDTVISLSVFETKDVKYFFCPDEASTHG